MKSKVIMYSYIIALVMIFCYLFWPSDGTGRYTIVLQKKFDYSGNQNEDRAILLDTKTGTIWTYYCKNSFESKKWHKEEFGD